jgi:hypothetical protein
MDRIISNWGISNLGIEEEPHRCLGSANLQFEIPKFEIKLMLLLP